jgi:hypothetical protein
MRHAGLEKIPSLQMNAMCPLSMQQQCHNSPSTAAAAGPLLTVMMYLLLGTIQHCRLGQEPHADCRCMLRSQTAAGNMMLLQATSSCCRQPPCHGVLQAETRKSYTKQWAAKNGAQLELSEVLLVHERAGCGISCRVCEWHIQFRHSWR